MAATDAMGYDAERTDPLYKHMPCFIVLTPCAAAPDGVLAYGVLYDSLALGVLDLGQEISAFRGSYRYYGERQPAPLPLKRFCSPSPLEACCHLPPYPTAHHSRVTLSSPSLAHA